MRGVSLSSAPDNFYSKCKLSRPCLTCQFRELTNIIGGSLSLGTMPPLGGQCEPVGRIGTDSRTIMPGDLFWGLEGERHNGAHYAEEALMRGAQGTVIAGRLIEPWAGGYSIRVPHAGRAFVQLGGWARSQYHGSVIGLAGAAGSATTGAVLHQLLQANLQGSADFDPLASQSAAVLSILDWRQQDEYAILDLGRGDDPEFAEISHLCRPQIIAITSSHKKSHHKSMPDLEAFAETQTRFLNTLPHSALVVVNGDDPVLRRAARMCSRKTLWVGRGSDCDVSAQRVCSHNGQLTFDVDGRRFEFPLGGEDYLTAALMAVAIGELLSVSLADLQSATRNLRCAARTLQAAA